MKQLPECKVILDKLIKESPAHLYYHTIHHTLDVYQCAKEIAKGEGINAGDLKLLLIAAIYHDAGYLEQNYNHEQHSCEIARKYLPQFQYNKEDINTICSIIMATKIPQNPQSHLEKIICDADLNYLGRDDFFSISEKLYTEMIAIGNISNREEWDRIQEEFLQKHHYFTATAIKLRKYQKEQNLEIVQSKTI
ncbi:HD domain-containing protein [Flavobacterium sp. ZS1P70]|uniref:HD domain-containing protein n=1 Tax=Flavobacterium zhoui TaxID=3230414 RepID=A0ABW6I1R3_9FLAO